MFALGLSLPLEFKYHSTRIWTQSRFLLASPIEEHDDETGAPFLLVSHCELRKRVHNLERLTTQGSPNFGNFRRQVPDARTSLQPKYISLEADATEDSI